MTRNWYKCLLTSLFFILISCDLNTQEYPTNISYDRGGYVNEYLARAKKAEGIKITGKCYSACLAYLGSKNTCISKNSTLGVHEISKGYMRKYWEREYLKMLPPTLVELYKSGDCPFTEICEIKGKELIKKGEAVECI